MRVRYARVIHRGNRSARVIFQFYHTVIAALSAAAARRETVADLSVKHQACSERSAQVQWRQTLENSRAATADAAHDEKNAKPVPFLNNDARYDGDIFLLKQFMNDAVGSLTHNRRFLNP